MTLAVEADRHLHFVQLLTSRSLNLSKASKLSKSPFAPCRKVPSIITRLESRKVDGSFTDAVGARGRIGAVPVARI